MSTVHSHTPDLAGLDELYYHLVAGAQADHRETWRRFAANRRFLTELECAARQVLRARRLPRDRAADVVNEALVILADRLRSRNSLGFDARYGKERFVAWIRAVVRSHCRHAVDRQYARDPRPTTLDDEWPILEMALAVHLIDLADAVQTLSEPCRSVAKAFAELGSVEAVARRLGLSRTTAWRRFREAVKHLKRRCCVELPSGRVVGVDNVARKW